LLGGTSLSWRRDLSLHLDAGFPFDQQTVN
jgi:hypothetical protein